MKIKLLILFILSTGIAACDSSPIQSDNQLEKAAEPNAGSVASPASSLTGEQLFFVCQACHNITDGAEHKVGPNLFGIINQNAATREGFAYSEPLKTSNLVWDKTTLTGWILATENLVPGTWMAYHNHLSVAETQRLVDYISEQK